MKELVDAGEVVALLGDRVGINDKAVIVDPRHTRTFPDGALPPRSHAEVPGVPYVQPLFLAQRLRVFLRAVCGEGQAPRHEREAALARYAQAYAARLEHYSRMSPYNWFNFYDFWKIKS